VRRRGLAGRCRPSGRRGGRAPYWATRRPPTRGCAAVGRAAGARWDGIAPQGRDGALTPADIRALCSYIQEHRSNSAPFDVLYIGNLPAAGTAAAAVSAEYEAAGVTWWLESFGRAFGLPLEQLRATIRNGPPRRK